MLGYLIKHKAMHMSPENRTQDHIHTFQQSQQQTDVRACARQYLLTGRIGIGDKVQHVCTGQRHLTARVA